MNQEKESHTKKKDNRKWWEKVIYFFPLQLLFVHLKKSQQLLLFWIFLFLALFQMVGAKYGVPFLFLAPEYLERSIDLSVSDNLPNYYTQLAVCYEEDGQTAKAIQAYKIACKETKDKVLLYHLARNYDVLYKDKKVALNYYEKYLEEKDTANEYLINYSKYRIQELKARLLLSET